MSKEKAVDDYGISYSSALEALNIRAHEAPPPSDPHERLLEQLDKYAQTPFDKTIRLTENLGGATEIFQFKTIEDAVKALGAEKRGRLEKDRQEISAVMMQPENRALLDTSLRAGGGNALEVAFNKAREKLILVNAFLASDPSDFTVEVSPLKAVVNLPDKVASKGDAVYVVESGPEAPPRISGGVIAETRLVRSIFGRLARDIYGQDDYQASYRINASALPAKHKEAAYLSVEGAEGPQGAFAKGVNRFVFNNAADAKAYMGKLLDTQEATALEKLESIRKARKHLDAPLP
jgi:hypothetical protein